MTDTGVTDIAKDAGLPLIDGKQAVGHASRHRLSDGEGGAVHWYRLEDGTEYVRDDAGNPAEWPD